VIDVEALMLERPWGRVLDGIGFVARTGVATAVIGAPGAGKSALLRCLATLDEPQAGRIRLAGVDPAREPATAHARLGYLAQHFGLYDALSVRRCLDHAARMRGLAATEAALAVEPAAERFGLVTALDRPAGELGDGGRLRLALAQATVHAPRVLLLDEPMTDLGPFERADVAAHFRDLAARGATVLVSAPDLADLAGCCTDLLRLEDGRVCGAGVVRDGARELAPPDPAIRVEGA
jgi:ABC-2 type transport system ATP-binding protein